MTRSSHSVVDISCSSANERKLSLAIYRCVSKVKIFQGSHVSTKIYLDLDYQRNYFYRLRNFRTIRMGITNSLWYGGELQNRVLVNLCDSTYSSASWDVVSARGTAMASLKLAVRVSQYRQYELLNDASQPVFYIHIVNQYRKCTEV